MLVYTAEKLKFGFICLQNLFPEGLAFTHELFGKDQFFHFVYFQ